MGNALGLWAQLPKAAPVMLILLPEVTPMGVVWTPITMLSMKLMLAWSE